MFLDKIVLLLFPGKQSTCSDYFLSDLIHKVYNFDSDISPLEPLVNTNHRDLVQHLYIWNLK